MALTRTVKECKLRHVIKISSTYYISLPKQWLTRNKILDRKNKELFVTVSADTIIISPRNEAGIFMKSPIFEKIPNLEFETPTTSGEQLQRREA